MSGAAAIVNDSSLGIDEPVAKHRKTAVHLIGHHRRKDEERDDQASPGVERSAVGPRGRGRPSERESQDEEHAAHLGVARESRRKPRTERKCERAPRAGRGSHRERAERHGGVPEDDEQQIRRQPEETYADLGSEHERTGGEPRCPPRRA